jgi:hypothetical protein
MEVPQITREIWNNHTRDVIGGWGLHLWEVQLDARLLESTDLVYDAYELQRDVNWVS